MSINSCCGVAVVVLLLVFVLFRFSKVTSLLIVMDIPMLFQVQPNVIYSLSILFVELMHRFLLVKGLTLHLCCLHFVFKHNLNLYI